MTYTILIKLTNYKAWTESLGYDREWIIQTTQSRIYYELQTLSKEFNGFTLPMRYDIQVIMLPSNATLELFISQLREVIARWSPIEVEFDVYCGLPHEILNNGFKSAECVNKEVCVAHLDLNNFTSKSFKRGFYQPYVEVLSMISKLALKLMDKAVVQYLGGDNIVIVTAPRYVEDVIKESMNEDIKIGVGISEYPRKAFEYAAKALNVLRIERKSFKYLIIKE
ncbi:MAG: GTP cyclohydrolase IIa [Sulfolobales archaeon]|nr:GTP cyclohydrolase IIa [Sulfolobales archaeon]